MDQQHEYAVLGGMNRATLGRVVTLIAAWISGAGTFLVLEAVDLAKQWGFPRNAPPIVLSLLSAGTVYFVLYWTFDRYIWRIPFVAKLLRVPNISGSWDCEGRTLNEDGSVRFRWEGKVKVVQTWDKIKVRVTTGQSTSNSVAAALQCDDAGGHRLLYHYRNDPRAGDPDLHTHRGFVDMFLSEDQRAAEGDYLNGAGRNTFGRMSWTKESVDAA